MIALWLAASGAAAESQKKCLAVLDLDSGMVHDQAAAIFGTEVDVERGMRNLILDYLEQDGTYATVGLEALVKNLTEQGLTPEDLTSPGAGARIGQLLGVDAVVMGTITQFGGEVAETAISLDGILGATETVTGRKAQAVVAVDVRVVDINSGEVVAVAEGLGHNKRTGATLMSPLPKGQGRVSIGRETRARLDVGTMDFSSPDFHKTALGEAVKDAAEQVVADLVAAHDRVGAREVLAVGEVVHVDEEHVVLGMGSRAGLKVGDRLPVERVTHEVRDPVTGDVIRRMRQAIGMVEITEVNEESADARVLSGSGFEVGDVAGSEKTTASGPATQILAVMLAREIEKRMAAGIDDDLEIEPSGADLSVGRSIFIDWMPYDFHDRIAIKLREVPEPFFPVTDDRKEADLWMRGTVEYGELMLSDSGVYRQLEVSVVLVPRGGSQPLWSAQAKGELPAADRIAKNLVKKLRKTLRQK
jgi:curli biogenesis system outer membrane secretion channel CsgG